MTSKTKRIMRRILLAFIITVLVLVLGIVVYIAVWLNTHNFTKTNLKYYEQFLQTDTVMPHLDSLGETLNLDFKWTNYESVSDAYLLTVSYTETEYETQKQAVLQKYTFEEKNIINHFGDSFDVRFTVDGFDFGVLSMEKYNSNMPNKFYCIGTSEHEHKIAYLFFQDGSLDSIPSWENLLRGECGWK